MASFSVPLPGPYPLLLSSGVDAPRAHAMNVYLSSARASLVSPMARFLGFPYSLGSRFMVAFTSGRVVGSSCPPKRWAAAIAARHIREEARWQRSGH